MEYRGRSGVQGEEWSTGGEEWSTGREEWSTGGEEWSTGGGGEWSTGGRSGGGHRRAWSVASLERVCICVSMCVCERRVCGHGGLTRLKHFSAILP